MTILESQIQYAPSFFRHIKTHVDSRKGQNGLFVVTGSRNFLLMENPAETLAGLAAVIPFLGLSGRDVDASTVGIVRFAERNAHLCISKEPAQDGTHVHFGSYDGYHYALDMKTGKQVWRARCGKGGCVAPTHAPDCRVACLTIRQLTESSPSRRMPAHGEAGGYRPCP